MVGVADFAAARFQTSLGSGIRPEKDRNNLRTNSISFPLSLNHPRFHQSFSVIELTISFFINTYHKMALRPDQMKIDSRNSGNKSAFLEMIQLSL